MLPTVSVVIPACNGTAFLGEALHSVCTQTLPPAEIIVVDDASKDGTPELVTAFASAAPVSIRLLRLRANSGGPARPLNVGIAAATGEFVAVQDQDDIFVPAKLRVQVEALASDPELTFAFGLCGALGSKDRTVQAPEVVGELLTAGEETGAGRRFSSRSMFRLLMGQGNVTMGYPGFLFRRRDWERRGGFDEGLRICSDYDFLCGLALEGPAVLIPSVLYYRRDHEANLCKRGREVYLETMRVKARYLARARWLLEDEATSQALRQELLGLAYWAREEGHPGEALEYYRLAGRLWGWNRDVLWALAKWLPGGLLGWCKRRVAGQAG